MITKEVLAQWFDLSKKIEREDLQIAIDQMALYAIKEGLDPDCAESKREYKAMKNAVRLHNEQFNHVVA